MTHTGLRKCTKCGAISYGLTRYGDQEWVYCAVCTKVYDAL